MTNPPLPQTILLLGSGELGKELTISLQRLGCRVVAVDSYESAPAMQVATSSRVIDMTDEEALAALIQEVQPALIVPEVEKLAASTLIDAEASGHRVVPSAQTVAYTFDRQGIRALAAEQAGVPTSSYAFASSYEELVEGADKVGSPCFVKPTTSSSGHGQSRVESPEQLHAAWEEAVGGGRVNTGRVIVEGEIPFDYEITLLTVRHLDADGKVTTSFCAPIGHRQESGDYVESWQPQAMTPAALARAKDIARAVTDTLAEASHQPTLGIFGVELFVRGEEVYFSELSPRPHDTGMVTLVSQDLSEFDLHARAILGLPLHTDLRSPGASAPLKSPIETSSPRFSGLDEALADPKVDVRIFGKPSAHLGRRMAVALATDADPESALARAKAARAKLHIS